ncbi:M20/M25/M40 family metallo-hydrolase [Kitasatospora sp. NBC_01539]|uniref:M20/M25/M40 family metallo-hydrolase n=1 Tax=Kitasatospora sp. NBC_01539 TaxID=2903577 RepID=UPI00386027E1
MTVYFFDIGATLADATVGADGVLVLSPRRRVQEVLDGLADSRRGVVSDPGPGEAARKRAAAALETAFPGRFPDRTLLLWGSKDSPEIFERAVAASGVPSADCVFVGEDPGERAQAREAGMATAAHPVFTRAAAQGRPVLFVRIGLPEDLDLAALEAVANTAEVVPLHVASARLVLAMATAEGAAVLEQAGFTADLREAVEETAAFLVRGDHPPFLPGAAGAEAEALLPGVPLPGVPSAGTAEAAGTAAWAGSSTGAPVDLGPAPGGTYLAATAALRVEELHLPAGRPGHTERLLADPALLSRPGEAEASGLVSAGAVRSALAAVPSERTVAAVRSAVTAAVVREHVARVSGAAPLVDGDLRPPVRSRNAENADNPRVVQALLDRLAGLGLETRRQEFVWRGHRLANVEAEHRVAGADGAVLVTAHLDSTALEGTFFDRAGLPRRYDPAVDPAPGADDDGSGVAAVLATAECLTGMLAAGLAPARSVRFVLFNAEEQGLVGSKSYARAAAATGDRISAVLQMDMIAGRREGPRTFEIHAGSAVAGPVEQASDALGAAVEQAAASVAPDLVCQRLSGPADPAAGRSDHASFHERGWPAVAVCENFFPDTAPETGTRQYHRPGDTLADPDHDTAYSAAVARTVATAALTLAGL